MLQYVIAGLVLGGIYAIASAGLVITYVSSGILNFAFGALAFFVARFYYYLHTQEGWGIPYSALVSIVVAGPALGVLL
jgi:branched-chain amino acid transport system permease protein